MKHLSFIVMITCFVACHTAPPELIKMQGDFDETGLVNISIGIPLQLYAGPDDTMPFDEITFSRVLFGKEKGSIAIKTTHLKDRLKPYQMGGGSSDEEGKQLINSGLGPWPAHLTFRVISVTPKYFEVLVNDSTKEIAYLKREGREVYETWTNYLKRCEYILINNYEIYNAPNGVVIEKVAATDSYKIVDVKGNWAQIVRENRPLWPVWILWRKNNDLNIEPVEHSME